MVEGLLRHFEHAQETAKPTEAQRKALEWLAGAMHFRAVDPDAPEPQDGNDAESADAPEEPEFAEAA